MTALRIDTAKFKAACTAQREEIARIMEIGNWTAEEFAAQGYADKKDWYEFKRSQFASQIQPATPTASDADELRSQLRVAAQAAQQFGATASQIDFIVALAIKNNDFNVLSGGRLSKTEASRIIDQMKG